MKYFLIVVLSSFSFLSFAQSLKSSNIQTDYLEAIKLSRAQNKGIMYVFTNNVASDASRAFETNFLNSSQFKKLSSKFILLEVNCSESVNPESNISMYCKRLSPIYNPDENYPAIMVTDKSQKPLGNLMTDFSKEKTGEYLNLLNSY